MNHRSYLWFADILKAPSPLSSHTTLAKTQSSTSCSNRPGRASTLLKEKRNQGKHIDWCYEFYDSTLNTAKRSFYTSLINSLPHFPHQYMQNLYKFWKLLGPRLRHFPLSLSRRPIYLSSHRENYSYLQRTLNFLPQKLSFFLQE